MKKLIQSIIIGAVGAVVLGISVYFAQTAVTVNRQSDNSQIKLDIAGQRMESYAQEIEDNWERYDSFSQAKADVLSYYYDRNPEKIQHVDVMASQWGAKEMYIFDKESHLISSNQHDNAEIELDTELMELLKNKTVFSRDSIRYYVSFMINGNAVVIGRDCSEYEERQKEIASYEHAFDTIRVGTNGFLVAVNYATDAVVYSKDHSHIGAAASTLGISNKVIEDGYAGWTEFQGVKYHAESRRVDDLVLIAMMPKTEITSVDSKVVVIAVLLYLLVASVVIVYMHNCRTEGISRRNMIRKGQSAIILSIMCISALTFYMQSILTLSRQSIRFTTKLADIEQIIEINEDRLTELTEEYTNEYTQRTQNIAYLIQQDPTLVNDRALEALSKRAQVKAIYVFNGNGEAIATNTVYKDFVISKDPKEQSYEFWNIIKGYEDTVIQQAQMDNTSAHNYIQYIGTKRLDDDGLVQLGISPQRLENRISTTKIDYTLDNIAVENRGFSFAVEKKTGNIFYCPESKYIGKPALDYGVSEDALEGDYSGYQTILGTKCYVSAMEHGDYYIYLAAPLDMVTYGRMTMTILIVCISLVFVLAIIFQSVFKAAAINPEEDEILSHGVIEHKTKKYIRIMLSCMGIISVIYFASYGSNEPMIKYIMSKRWKAAPSIFSFSYICFVLVTVIVASVVIRKIMEILMVNMGAKSRTIGKLISNFIKYFSVIGTVFYCLNFLGVDTSTLLASAGLLTLIIGLGAQSLVSDILAGIFIVFEGEFQVGDVITVGTWRGKVLEIGIRSTKIEDASNNIKILNNSSIKDVINMTRASSYALCDVGIEYGESLERVETILEKELPKFKERIPGIEEGPFYKGVVSLADSSVVIRIIVQCNENDKIQLTRDLNREMKLLFDKHNINIPFPQIVINNREENKEESAKKKHTEHVEAEKFVKEQREVSKDVHAN